MFIKNDWAQQLEPELMKPYMKNLFEFLHEEYEHKTIYPQKENVFAAFQLTPYSKVRVVILGQDPYHGPNQANGLSFSVEPRTAFPPSLRNIFKELVNDIGCGMPESGDLSPWAQQGVLLLNTTLTVEAGSPMSHARRGWEEFTDKVLRDINEKSESVIFILWGGHARKKIALIDRSKHFVIESAHPSPLAAHRGFFGSKPFSKTNAFLESKGQAPINWCLNS